MNSINRFLIIVRIAARNLVQAPRRTLWLALAIAMVTALLVLFQGISEGTRGHLLRSATTLSAGHVNVSGFYKTTPTDVTPLIEDGARARRIVEENTTGAVQIVDRQRGFASLITAGATMQAGVAGVDIEDETILADVLQLAEESEYVDDGRQEVVGDIQGLSRPNTAVIFAGQARRLDARVGDTITLRTQTFRGQANTVDVTVVAVAQDIGLLSNFAIFVPSRVVLDLYDLSDQTTGALLIYLEDIDRSEEVMDTLRAAFLSEDYTLLEHQPEPFFAKFETVSGEDWTGQRLDLTTWEDEISFLTWIVTALDTIAFLLIGILAIIIAVGMMNTMWISVRERTPELGTVRAIGMTRTGVLLLFAVEAFLLGLAASLAGAALGTAVAAAITAAQIPIPSDAVRAILLNDIFVLVVGLKQVLGAVIAMTLVMGLAAFFPAWRASRMQPVEAIHR